MSMKKRLGESSGYAVMNEAFKLFSIRITARMTENETVRVVMTAIELLPARNRLFNPKRTARNRVRSKGGAT